MRRTDCTDDVDMGDALQKEYDRWKDYASALLIANPVLLAGIALASQNHVLSGLAGFAGVFGLISVVMWYARERNWQWRSKPLFLVLASILLGVQAGCLAIAFVSR